MKKNLMWIGIIITTIVLFLFTFSNKKTLKPNEYYKVYLDGEILGTIKSKNELDNYINSQGTSIKENVKKYQGQVDSIDTTLDVFNKLKLSEEENNVFKNLSNKERAKYVIDNSKRFEISDLKLTSIKYYYNKNLYNLTSDDVKEMKDYISKNKIYITANKVYTPNGIEVKKISTYDDNITTVGDMYKKIISKKNCTVAGYRFIIKSDDKNEKEKTIYVTDKKVFEEAVDTIAGIFAGSDNYKKYKEKTQNEITDTGFIIENVYVDEDITYKAVNISTDENIYTDASTLSKYLLYGDNYSEEIVKVEEGDSIETIAFNNKISVDEFLISNQEYTDKDNLLYAGKEVVIAQINPQINLVVETHRVEDVESNYNTIEQQDSNLIQGDEVVVQEGVKGVDRVTQNVKSVNGQINYVQTEKKETIKAATNKIITVGSKIVPSIGSTKSWGWPTKSGYTITSGFSYRISPVNGSHELHTGLDIAGTGYGSPVYASNNGTISEMSYHYSYGNHIIINHGNGYYSLYAHMSGFVSGLHVGSIVERGQQIGYVGTTGAATGPHLHYEIRTCEKYSCVTNPLNYY